jgi:hypothetical protein
MVSVLLTSLQLLTQGKEPPMEHPTFYRTTQIDGLSIFYRECQQDRRTSMQDDVRHCQKGIKRRFVTPTTAVKLASFGPASWPNVKKVPNDWLQELDPGEIRFRVTLYLSTSGATLFSAMLSWMSRS